MKKPARIRRDPRLPPDRPLNERELRFVAEYRAQPSLRRAALAAGYSEGMGAHLVKRPDIQAAIASHPGPLPVQQVFAEIEIRARHVLAETMRVAFANLKNVFNTDGTPRALGEIDADTRAGLRTIETEERPASCGTVLVLALRRHDKMAALAELGRHYGLFDESADDAGDVCPTAAITEAGEEADAEDADEDDS